MRRWLCMFLLIGGASLPACSYFGEPSEEDGEEEEGDAKPPTPATVVEWVPVVRGEVADVLSASAVIEAEASADLMPAASGMVVQVLKDVGDPVSKGQVLAILDNTSLDASAERARAEVRHLEARLAEMQQLQASGAVSAREVADVDYQLRTARTTLREATAGYGETRITAPFNGVVAAREIKVGEQVGSAARAFQVVDLSVLRVTAALPERDVSRVRLGQHATLIGAYDTAQTARATVTRLSPVIDAGTGTFQVTLTLDDAAHSLRPGQFVSVELEVARRTDVWVVPRASVLYDNGVPVVYVRADAPPEEEDKEEEGDAKDDEAKPDEAKDDEAKEDEAKDDEAKPEEPVGPQYVARRVLVELGLTDTEFAEITSGLNEGDLVITIGHHSLKDGARIREPKPAEPAAPAADGAATEAAAPAASGEPE